MNCWYSELILVAFLVDFFEYNLDNEIIDIELEGVKMVFFSVRMIGIF